MPSSSTRVPILKYIMIAIALFLLYYLIAGVLLFSINRKDPSAYMTQRPNPASVPNGVGPDRIALVEEPRFSGVARIQLIQAAQKSIDVAYYSIQDDKAGHAFYNALLQAADRNVKVRILMEGVVNMGFKSTPYRDALTNHPNITIRFYEPFSLFKPWRLQNRLHDKILLIDQQTLLTGGRNVGERYYIEDNDMAVYDRDILIVRTNQGEHNESVMPEAARYYETLWTSEFTQPLAPKSPADDAKVVEFLKTLRTWNETNLKPATDPIDWLARSFPTHYIRMIHNPLERFQKNPQILAEISEAIKNAKKNVVIQSPYIVMNNPMQRIWPEKINVPLTILTNSAAVSPNFFAASGYANIREDLAGQGTLYEYQGNGSLHGKSYIIDEHLSIVGTFNLDPRSSFLSTESMMVIESPEFAAGLRKNMQHLMDQSLPVNADGSFKAGGIAEKPISNFKKYSLKTFSYIVRPFIYMM